MPCWTRADDLAVPALALSGAAVGGRFRVPHPCVDRRHGPVERRALQRGEKFSAQRHGALVDAPPGHPPSAVLHAALGLGAAGRREPGQPAAAVLVRIPGGRRGDGGPVAGVGAGPMAGCAAVAAAGFLQPVPGAVCDRGQELCPAGVVGGAGLVVAPGAAALAVRHGRSLCRLDPLLWLVCRAGNGHLGCPATPPPVGVGGWDRSVARRGLDHLRL